MLTKSTMKFEVKILMSFFKIPISEYNNLLSLHGGVDGVHSHLSKLFDERNALKN
jgi:hypothetical protein